MWSRIIVIQTGSQGRAGYMIAGGYSFHFTDPACKIFLSEKKKYDFHDVMIEH